LYIAVIFERKIVAISKNNKGAYGYIHMINRKNVYLYAITNLEITRFS